LAEQLRRFSPSFSLFYIPISISPLLTFSFYLNKIAQCPHLQATAETRAAIKRLWQLGLQNITNARDEASEGGDDAGDSWVLV
jgi:hypothetical protein